MSEDRGRRQYDVEPPADEPADIRSLDVCPKCGASLPDIRALVCLRCGFDLKAMKVIDTRVGEEAAPSGGGGGGAGAGSGAGTGDVEDSRREPLAMPGRGALWLPLTLAGTGALALIVGYLAGTNGLFGGGESAGAVRRVLGLSRALAQVLLLAVAGVGALVAVARLLAAPLGDLRLAAARMLGIVAVVAIARFLNLGSDGLEWTVETVVQAAAFVGLTMLFFQLDVREALTTLGLLVLAIAAVMALASITLWALAWEAAPATALVT